MAYIVIDNFNADGSKTDPTVMRIDTDEQREAAKAELRARGLQFERISVGDPEDPDSYQTTDRLHA